MECNLVTPDATLCQVSVVTLGTHGFIVLRDKAAGDLFLAPAAQEARLVKQLAPKFAGQIFSTNWEKIFALLG